MFRNFFQSFLHSYYFSGELYLVPKERIYYLKLSPAEVMKFIVSGGVTRFESVEQLKIDQFEEKQ
jgi:uncharacterized membrane protein